MDVKLYRKDTTLLKKSEHRNRIDICPVCYYERPVQFKNLDIKNREDCGWLDYGVLYEILYGKNVIGWKPNKVITVSRCPKCKKFSWGHASIDSTKFFIREILDTFNNIDTKHFENLLKIFTRIKKYESI